MTLSVADGRITHERRYHDVGDLRRCVDGDELPEVWWTRLEPPPLPEDEVTGVVGVSGQEIEIHNGTPALERLVAWAFDRFDAAGLGVLAVDVVSFDEDVPWAQRGVEWAANALAWGVTDERIDATKGRACAVLSAAFELLTGEQPQQPCARSVSG